MALWCCQLQIYGVKVHDEWCGLKAIGLDQEVFLRVRASAEQRFP